MIRGRVQYAAALLLVAAAYVFFGKFGLSLAFTVKQVTAVWPPTGIAVAAIVLGGYRMWPAIFVGAFLANALTNEPLATAAGIAVGNTVGPLVAGYLLRRARFDPSFGRVRDAAAFLGFAAVLSMTITATNGTLQLLLAHLAQWPHASAIWLQWWIGDAAGVLLVGPLILTWGAPARKGDVEASPAEIVALLVVSAVALSAEFSARSPIAFPLYPCVVWAALRVGARLTTLLLIVTAAIVLWATLHDLGPFGQAPVVVRMNVFIIFIAVLAVTGLVLYALTAERRGALSQSQAAERRFQALAQTVPQIVWTADASGTIDWVNERWAQFAGERELLLTIEDWSAMIARGTAFDRELLLTNTDGVSRWFLLRVQPLFDDRGTIVRWYGTYTDIDEQRRTLERTARIATTLQSAFLPDALPQHENVVFDALYLTAGREGMIGGDWYDAFTLGDDRIVISIGDVTGHGLTAAVGASRIRQSIVAAAIDVHDPAAILEKANRLVHFHGGTVATACVAILDPNRLTLHYASAGHPAPVIATPNAPAFALPLGSLPLGVSPTAEYRTLDLGLERGSVVVFYTDGVTEFERDIETAERRLFAAVDTLVATPSEYPARSIRHAVMQQATPADDAVIVVVRIPQAASARLPETQTSKTWNFHSQQAYSAHSARHELMRFIQAHAEPAQELFTTELILGELLANTVEHAPGLVTVEIDWSDEHPLLTVIDNGPGLERFASVLPDDPLTEDGRGLFLVQQLAREARIETDRGHGTKITVTLPLRTA